MTRPRRCSNRSSSSQILIWLMSLLPCPAGNSFLKRGIAAITTAGTIIRGMIVENEDSMTTGRIAFDGGLAAKVGPSRPLLPVRRFAAAVETRDDGQRFIRFDNKHERVGKAAEQGAVQVLVDHGKLAWGGAHSLDYGVNRCAETPAQAGSLVLIPVLRVDQLGAGARCKDYRIHYGQRCSSSAFNAAQVMPFCRSWSTVARRLSSSARCAVVRGRWSSSKLSQSCEMSARRSGGVSRTSSSWVSNSMHRA